MQIGYAEALHGLNHIPYRLGRTYPPNRLEVSNLELLSALTSLGSSNSLAELQRALRAITGCERIVFAPSCRAALAAVLRLLPQQEVVLPAYTCPVVAHAAHLAEKRIIYVDISPDSLNATSKQFAREARPGRILIPTHTFGIPTDIEEICLLARDRGCITVEDAAAAFGARRNNRALGTFADFGVFSFERSKRIPAFRGAFILVNNSALTTPDELASHVSSHTVSRFPLHELIHAMWYNLATRPELYGRLVLPSILRRYARLEPRNAAEPVPDGNSAFYSRAFHPYQAAVAIGEIRNLQLIRDHVSHLVRVYRETFRDSPIRIFASSDSDDAALLRFPISSHVPRAAILQKALELGLYLETNFEQSPPQPNDVLPIAAWAARNIILLPLYRRLPISAARRIASTLIQIVEQIAAATSQST